MAGGVIAVGGKVNRINGDRILARHGPIAHKSGVGNEEAVQLKSGRPACPCSYCLSPLPAGHGGADASCPFSSRPAEVESQYMRSSGP